MNTFKRLITLFSNLISKAVLLLILGETSGFYSIYAEEVSEDTRISKPHLQGRISEGRYYGLDDFFSIAMPTTSSTAEIEDFFVAPNVGGIAFFNHSGFLLKVEIEEVAPEVSYFIKNYPEIKGEILDAIFNDVLLPQLKTIVPKLSPMYIKKVTLPNKEEALFAVVNLPETATLIDLTSGRKLDSKRGYLLFFTKDNREVVNLNLQDTLSLIPTVAEAAKTTLNERLLNHLIQYQNTFQLEKKG